MQLLDDPFVFVFNLKFQDMSLHPKFHSEKTKNLFMNRLKQKIVRKLILKTQ